jgi:wyosine [tRNA(Phe)-imidazoG37] synthetase (radical SAM superfamily)
MLLAGLNDSEEELGLLRQLLRMLAPNKIQLNTAVRPVVEDLARPLSRWEMAAAAAFIGGPVEVIASFDREEVAAAQDEDADFLEMLSRRPMTASDLAQVLGLPLAQVQARLKRLKKSGSISFNRYHDQTFYRCQLKG